MKIHLIPEEGDTMQEATFERVYEFVLVGHHSFDRAPLSISYSCCAGGMRLIGKLDEAKASIMREITLQDMRALLVEMVMEEDDGHSPD